MKFAVSTLHAAVLVALVISEVSANRRGEVLLRRKRQSATRAVTASTSSTASSSRSSSRTPSTTLAPTSTRSSGNPTLTTRTSASATTYASRATPSAVTPLRSTSYANTSNSTGYGLNGTNGDFVDKAIEWLLKLLVTGLAKIRNTLVNFELKMFGTLAIVPSGSAGDDNKTGGPPPMVTKTQSVTMSQKLTTQKTVPVTRAA